MYNEIIKLLHESANVNEYGDTIKTITERTVFADLRSIGQSEFYQAQALGFKPEIKFVLSDYLDYQNEEKLKYQPFGGIEETYTILRTYRSNNELELVVYRDGGS